MTITEDIEAWNNLGKPKVQVSYTAKVAMPTAQLGCIVPSDYQPKRLTVAHIQKIVAEHFNLTREDLISDRRAKGIARPRQIAMWLCRKMTERTTTDIGRRFGDRDHTTVIHAFRRIEDLQEMEHFVRADCQALMKKLEAFVA